VSATDCNTLQHTALHCNTLQHTATHCNTLQHIVSYLCVYSVWNRRQDTNRRQEQTTNYKEQDTNRRQEQTTNYKEQDTKNKIQRTRYTPTYTGSDTKNDTLLKMITSTTKLVQKQLKSRNSFNHSRFVASTTHDSQ